VLTELVERLRAQPGPALTWYAGDGTRTELGGPVAARWVTKTANLLATELAGDLFGAPEPSAGTVDFPAGVLRVDLGRSWQAVVWTAAAWLSGWQVTFPAPGAGATPGGNVSSSDEGDATVWVVASLDAAAVEAAQSGVWVLAHDLTPLALSWRGDPLPEGVLDALGELMAQPDGVVGLAPGERRPDISFDHDQRYDESLSGRMLVTAEDSKATTSELLTVWERGGSAVVVDPERHDAQSQARIAQIEGARTANG